MSCFFFFPFSKEANLLAVIPRRVLPIWRACLGYKSQSSLAYLHGMWGLGIGQNWLLKVSFTNLFIAFLITGFANEPACNFQKSSYLFSGQHTIQRVPLDLFVTINANWFYQSLCHPNRHCFSSGSGSVLVLKRRSGAVVLFIPTNTY